MSLDVWCMHKWVDHRIMYESDKQIINSYFLYIFGTHSVSSKVMGFLSVYVFYWFGARMLL